jgi:hypothetical protein
MTQTDRAAMTMLEAVTHTIAGIDGPISSRVGAGVLLALSGIIQERRAPLEMNTLQAIMGLVVAIRDDVAA